MVNTAHKQADVEQTTELLVENAASTASVADTEQTAEFLIENAASTASVADTEQTSARQITR
jgi:hypothetical protein